MSARTAQEALAEMAAQFHGKLGEMEANRWYRGTSIQFVHNGRTYELKLAVVDDIPRRGSDV